MLPRASLTASLVGNAWAISGSRTTTFDPSDCRREAYLPRTKPFGKSERLYSRRNSLPLDRLLFLIKLSFRPRSAPGTNDADSISPFSMGYHQQATILR